MHISSRSTGRLLFAAGVTGALALALTGCASNGASGQADTPGIDSTTDLSTQVLGTWGSVNDGEPNLTLIDDGTYTGNDGCNQLMGSFSTSGDTITFGSDGAMTLMACMDVDDWLNGMATGKVVNNVLEISNIDGDVIGTLSR
ncbi:META domain-containing protein [Leucobacter sp. cx-42]|uniref:META domain-containing protein n=1 Tax=unclassified Leucobacter TaxID=2621730 RepID=UPI00165D80FE|nr:MULTISPECIES: META domain-containing protein [unclassified Leucobacter]MBC9955412.1 META domain-containing protein [Leucobacter sp. cx-42]